MTAIEAHTVVGTYAHMFPYATMARRALWRESNDFGERILEQAFPSTIRRVTRENELSIEFLNGSIWQAMSADDPRAAVGTNLKGVVFSEYALYPDSEAWDYIRPILAKNGGWAMFISTYRGSNHHYQLVRLNRDNPDWYTRELSVNDTRDCNGLPIVSDEMIDAERRSGMSEALIQQEYYNSPVAAFSGAYYQTMMRRARADGRVGDYPYNPNEPVFVAFDVGYADHAVAVFFQALQPDKTVFIGSQSWQFTPPAEIALEIKEKYPWGPRIQTVILPHDANRPGPTGDTWVTVFDRHRLAQQETTVLRKGQNTLHSEISHVQMNLRTCYFDNSVRDFTNKRPNNDTLLENLAAYRTETVHQRPGTFSRTPLHDTSSHWADAMRYALVYRHGDYMPGQWGPPPDYSSFDKRQVRAWTR